MMSEPEPTVPASTRWYAFSALAHQEATAEANLARQGYSIFVPRLMVTRRRGGRFETKRAWLFPRYGFVALDLERQRWRSINGTFGVSSLVMATERPLPVPTGIVEEMLAAADENGVIDYDRDLQPGSTVEMVAGPFSGTLATLVRLDGRSRAELLLNLMGGGVRLTVARDMLTPHRVGTGSN
jgi:transcriptional antiterminator RfaH